MNPEYIAETFNFKTIANNTTYNGTKLRIREITRKDGELMSRKKMKKMCNQFLVDLKEKYPGAEGLVSVTIKYDNRWYSGDVSNFNEPINYFSLDDYEEFEADPGYYEAIRFQFIPFKRLIGAVKMNTMIVLLIAFTDFLKPLKSLLIQQN